MTYLSDCKRFGCRGLILSLFVLIGLGAGPRLARATLRVVTTTPSYEDMVKQIGGKYVSVKSVMRGVENPHNVKPRPTQMLKVKHANLFIHSGLDLEAWSALLIRGARNRNLYPGQPGNVDVSKGIKLKEVPQRGQLTRALGDIHVFGNPHYALDPLNGIIIARTITSALQKADPSHKDVFEKNYQAYAERLRALNDRLVAEMKPYAGTPVVTYHRTWPYFLDRFGLVAIAEVEPKPGIAPGPQHLKECAETMKTQDAKIVIVETYNSKENAEFVAKMAGGKALVLAQEVRAVSGVDTYEQMFEYNIDALLKAFKETGVKPRSSVAQNDAEVEETRQP